MTSRATPGPRAGSGTLRGPLAARLGLVAALGTLAILLTSGRGIGISPDSVVYIGSGQALADGRGLIVPGTSVPLTIFAPLYPALLGTSSALGLDAASTARWLSALLFGVAIVEIGALGLRATRSAGAALLIAGLTLTAMDQLEVYAWAWSEPLFIALVLGFLLVLLGYLERGGRRRLAAAGALAALAALTRYAGAAALFTGALAILLLARRAGRSRLGASAAFLLMGGAPFGLWLLRNAHLTGQAAARSVALDAGALDEAGSFAGAMASWFVPVSVPAAIRIAALLAALAAAGAALLLLPSPGHEPERPSRTVALLALFAVLYLALIGATVVTLHPPPSGEPERILAPLWGPIVTILVAGAHRIVSRGRRSAARTRRILLAGPVVALTLVALLSASRAGRWLVHYLDEGHGFVSRRWTGSELVRLVRAEPASRPIFSNVTPAVYWLAGRGANPLPSRLEPRTTRPNPRYDAQLAAFGRSLTGEGGRIVYFDLPPGHLPPLQDLLARLHLVILARTPDGWLLGPEAR